MGFTTGFTGGVTLTLSIAYLTVLAHQRNREHQAAVLRQQTRLISGIVDPLPPTLPPTRAELAAADRANLTERAKDRWNAEIEGAVRWAQNKDWDEAREDLEVALARLWARASGGEVQERAGERAKSGVDTTINQGKEKAGSVAAAAKSAYADAKTKGSEVATQTGEKAEETRSSILGAIASGFRRGKEVAGRAKSAVIGAAEQKVEENTSGLSAEEKALKQRYQGSAGFDKSPEEVLASRYGTVSQQNSAQLKGI